MKNIKKIANEIFSTKSRKRKIGETWIEATEHCIMTEIGVKRYDSDDLDDYRKEVERIKKLK